MDDFEKHRSTLVGVSQKVAWLGIGHPRLGSTSPAKDLDPTLWAAVVGRVSQEQTKHPPTSKAICRFFYRGTLSLQQGFAWRSSQLTTRQATKPPAASDSSLSTPGTATAAKEVAEDAQDSESDKPGGTSKNEEGSKKDSSEDGSNKSGADSGKRNSRKRKDVDEPSAAKRGKR